MQIEICRKLYRSGSKQDDEDDEDSPVTVGHNIYILAHQVRERERERQRERDRQTEREELELKWFLPQLATATGTTQNKALLAALEKAKKIPDDPVADYASRTAQIEV